MYGGYQKSHILRQFFSNAFYFTGQLSVLVFVNQGNQPVTYLQSNQISRHDIIPTQLPDFRGRQLLHRGGCPGSLGSDLLFLLLFDNHPGGPAQAGCQQQEGQIRHARY